MVFSVEVLVLLRKVLPLKKEKLKKGCPWARKQDMLVA